MKQQNLNSTRLQSLDILRGFDLFLLVFFQPVFVSLAKHWENIPIFSFFLGQFNHVEWQGFHAWDLVMPLFLFMVGAAMPFSFEKYKTDNGDKKNIYKKIVKRFIILFILGMVVQGNILSFSFLDIRLFTNTLQSIAVGYAVSAIFLLYLSTKFQIIATSILLIGYWALLTFFGDFTPNGNFAELVDKIILGRFRDGVYYSEYGNWHFSDNYHYTWILSSMTFVVTVMLGVFAGKIMKNGPDKLKNSKMLFSIGLSLILSGWILGFQTPIIKKIWSASMTIFSGGWCYILMSIFYYTIDYKEKIKGVKWLKIYGMNSIVAYTLGMVINFQSIAQSIFWGLEHYVGEYYSSLIIFTNYLIIFLILKMMYQNRIFVKI